MTRQSPLRISGTKSQQLILITAFPKISSDVAEIYLHHWLEKSGQRLDYVNHTHLVLASTTKTLALSQI